MMLPLRLLQNSAGRFARTWRFYSSFEDAQNNMKKLPEEPDVETKLKIYGLFKQGTVGNATSSRPSAFDFAGRAKYDAWKANDGLSKEDAQEKYAQLIQSLLHAANIQESSQTASSSGIPGLNVTTEGKVFKIQLNRPDKFNAITWEMYEGLIDALNTASKDRRTSLTVITGSGDYYCSGNDLSNFTRIKTPEDMKELAENAEKILERYVRAHINHEKPLIALVNGPAIGISVTLLALCDLVIASDKASFQTPFTSLGQSPEGCSSFTFPAIMGPSKASEMLLFGKKLTAEEALERNLVAQVIPHAQFAEESMRKITDLSKLPPESLRLNKGLVRDVHKERLLSVNIAECAFLKKRWLSAECHAALQGFMSRKK